MVVTSYATWQKRLRADPNVIGRRISLDRRSYEIVGVMPPGFYPAPSGRYAEVWTPHWANEAEKEDHVTWGLLPLARLKPGVSWQHPLAPISTCVPGKSRYYLVHCTITMKLPVRVIPSDVANTFTV